MPDFDLITAAQLDALRGIIRGGGSPEACELIAVRLPAPMGTRYRSFGEFDRMPLFGPGLAARGIVVDARKTSGYFLDLQLTDEINEDTVTLQLLDHDRELTRLFQQYGAGHQVEVFCYFPQIDALVSVWWGHLRPPREGGKAILECSAASGFRNAQVPLPRRVLFTGSCQALYPVGLFTTQAEIDEFTDCPVNKHVGGDIGLLDPATGEVFATCPRDSRAACIARIGDDLSFLSADTIVEAINNGQTKGPALLAYSRGNETNLKAPLRVVFGFRVLRDLEVAAYTRLTNTNNPDKGFVRVLFPVCEGSVKSLRRCATNNTLIGIEHLNVRLGHRRQARTSFSPSVSNMSGTAHFFGNYGQVDPVGYNASNLKGQCDVEGLDDVKVYSAPGVFVKQYSTNRAWCLKRMFEDPRWGRGYRPERFVIEDWLDLGPWCDETVSYRTADGQERTTTRSTFNAELVGRPGSQQFSDVCLFGRFGRPFRHNGQVRVVPLRKETIDASIPVFTDEGPDANIVITEEGSQLFWSQIDPAELTNQLVGTFEDAAHQNVERPLTVSDQRAQKAAAAALGDTGVHSVSKPYSLLGVTNEGEAIRLLWMLLNLSEFDEGGILNNLRVRFLTNTFETLNLRRYQLIKVASQKIAGFQNPDGHAFQYFRVLNRKRQSDLCAEVIAQAYPVEYYEQMEDVVEPPVLPGPVVQPNPGGGRGRRPEPLALGSIDFSNDRIFGVIAHGGI